MSGAGGDRPEERDRRLVAWVVLAVAVVLTAGAVASVRMIWGGRAPSAPREAQKVPSAPGPDNSVTSAPGRSDAPGAGGRP